MLTGLLRPLLASVNMVNAPAMAKQRNIDVRVVTSETIHDYQTLLTVEVVTERGPRAVSGTLFQDLGRGWSRSAASRSRPGWGRTCSMSATRTSRA